MSARVRTRALVAVIALLGGALASPGCARRTGPPPIADGATCAACGMTAGDRRFACERETAKGWRVYDSIECLIRDGADRAWLADYDTKSLHAAESLWVVKGSFPSPMGGGFAAFADRATADTIAARTAGRVDRLAAFAAGAAR